jgi:hypothetical protein
MKTISIFAAATLCCGMVACSRQSPGPSTSTQLYSEDEVRKFVLPGTSRESIISRFGQPTYVQKNPKYDDGSTNVDEILFFDLPSPNPPRSEKWVFSGFVVDLKDGKALRWTASHRDTHVSP